MLRSGCRRPSLSMAAGALEISPSPACSAALRSIVEQLARGPDGALGLPERRAAVVAEGVQRADVGERDDFVAPQAGARDEIVERHEAAARPAAQSCEQMLQNQRRSSTRSSIDRSSQPHLGQPGRPGLQASGFGLGRGDRLADLLPQPAHIPQPEPNRAVGFDRAVPVRHLHVDRDGTGRRGAARP